MRRSKTWVGNSIAHMKVVAISSILLACCPDVWAQETVPTPPAVAEPAAPATPSPASSTVEKPPAAPEAAKASEAAERNTLQHLLQRAESGEANAQFQLAHRYLNGEGVATDNFMALQWFTRAAEQGNSNAQYNIAVMYLNGIGVIQDNTAAVDWFQKAAENGDAQAQFTLAIILFNGQYGTTRNVPQAYKWFTLAGSAGIREAAANAVLIQEMMPPGQVGQMQQEALDWIENYQSQQIHPEQ